MTKKSVAQQTSKTKHYCKFCKKTIIGSLFKLKSHLYIHNAVKPRFKCKHCTKAYFRYDVYNRHMKTHESSKQISRSVYICDFCDRSYVDKRNLITHLRIHDDTVSSNLVRFTCKACQVDYCEKRILLNHIRRVHFNQVTTNKPLHIDRKVNESWYETVVQSDVCVQMTKVNNNIISIKKHCKIKNVKFCEPKRNDTVNTHILRSDNYTLYSKAVCDYCNKEMLKKSIQNHIRERHLNIRKFECTECKRCFHRRYQLADHICKGTKKRSPTKKVVET